MTQCIQFITPRGAKIDLSLVTEAPNLADHTVLNRVWEMRVLVNGNAVIAGWFGLVQHKDHGRCIRVGDNYIQVPGDALAGVEALVGKFETGQRARMDAIDAADRAYQAQYGAVERLLATGRA